MMIRMLNTLTLDQVASTYLTTWSDLVPKIQNAVEYQELVTNRLTARLSTSSACSGSCYFPWSWLLNLVEHLASALAGLEVLVALHSLREGESPAE
jgi:hypothetical protein